MGHARARGGDLAVMLALGGTTISDIETLRHGHRKPLGKAASEPTAWRTIEALGLVLPAQYHRLRGRKGPAKATGSVRHSILVAA